MIKKKKKDAFVEVPKERNQKQNLRWKDSIKEKSENDETTKQFSNIFSTWRTFTWRIKIDSSP